MGDRLATIDMGRKERGCAPFGRGAGSPSNAMWLGSRPISTPSFSMVHIQSATATICPQYTNITHRQTGRTGQRSASIGRTVLQMVAQKLTSRTQQTFFTLAFWSLPETFIRRSLFSSSGSCHNSDVAWQEIGRTYGLVCSCPCPGSRIIIPLSEYVLLLWSTEYFCQILCPEL